jgi:hypothetical protein
MPKYYHPDLLDYGLDRVRAKIAASNTVKLHALKAYTAGDSYSTASANSIGSVALAEGDLTLGNQGTNGRQLAVAAKNITATADAAQIDSGTATSGGASTLTDTGKSWTTDQHLGRVVKITAGTGSGQSKRISANTATQLTVESAWSTAPDATSQYKIVHDLHVAILDQTESKVLIVTDETSNQQLLTDNILAIPSWNAKQNQPT